MTVKCSNVEHEFGWLVRIITTNLERIYKVGRMIYISVVIPCLVVHFRVLLVWNVIAILRRIKKIELVWYHERQILYLVVTTNDISVPNQQYVNNGVLSSSSSSALNNLRQW